MTPEAIAAELEQYDRHHDDICWQLAEGKATEIIALNRMWTLDFYRLLESARRNIKTD